MLLQFFSEGLAVGRPGLLHAYSYVREIDLDSTSVSPVSPKIQDLPSSASFYVFFSSGHYKHYYDTNRDRNVSSARGEEIILTSRDLYVSYEL